MATTALPGARVMRKKNGFRWWIPLLILAVVGAAGYLAYQRLQPAAPTTTNSMSVPVTRGDLVASVSATGNIRSANQVDLNFQTGGIVQEVLVKTGSVVTKGQPLVRLDTMDLALSVKNDEAALETAQLKLDEAREGASEADLVAAQSKVDSAQAALDALSAGPTSTEVAEAQSRLASARASLEKAKAGPTNAELANARNQIETAKNSLWASQSSRDATCGRAKHPDEDTNCNQARASVNNAELGVQTAQNNLDKLLAGPNANDVLIAEQSVRQAELALSKLRQPATADKIASAQANLVQAQTALDELKAGPNTRTVRQAEIAVTQAQSKLEQSQLKLQQATLVAPADGVVTTVKAAVGQRIGDTSNPITMVDLTNLEIETPVSEFDRPKVKIGQPAEITIEALPGVTLKGEVTAIGPSGTASNGVVNFPVTVKVTSQNAEVAPGMTANMVITVENKQSVLRVPNRAIQTVGNQKLVTVKREGEDQTIPVQAGITDGAMTEITSPDLKEGDQVVLDLSSGGAGGGGLGGPGEVRMFSAGAAMPVGAAGGGPQRVIIQAPAR